MIWEGVRERTDQGGKGEKRGKESIEGSCTLSRRMSSIGVFEVVIVAKARLRVRARRLLRASIKSFDYLEQATKLLYGGLYMLVLVKANGLF